MVDYRFSLQELEWFLLVMSRVAAFVFISPFFSMSQTPRRVRAALAIAISLLLALAMPPYAYISPTGILAYAALALKEAAVGLLLGLASAMCISIANFAGSLVDMDSGLSMASLWDPTTKSQTGISGMLYQYAILALMLASGMFSYLIGALADSFVLIPVNGAVLRAGPLVEAMTAFMADFLVLGFRIALPVFSVLLLLNGILGILAKVSPQMNMFSVGLQLKILAGLGTLFFTAFMIPSAAEMIFVQTKELMKQFAGALM